jgi:signal transduction histidine kinase
VLFPLLVWAGVRHGVLAASVASAVLTVTLLATLSHTPTLFAGADAPRLHQEIEIYLFILIGTVSALTPAALIEERGAMDRQLRVSERRFLDLTNSIHEAFFVVDVDQRRVTYANSAANVLLAAAPGAQFDAEAWLAEVHPDDRRVVQAQAAMLERGQVAHATVRIPGHDTEWRWLFLRAYPVAADDSGMRCVSCVAADVTALRHAEEQLRHAQKMEAVGQFASGIAHDFNNVLTVTMVAADALENALPADSEAWPEVAAIRGASDRAAQLTQQLLRFSRREPAARSIVPLHGILREMMPLLSRLVGRRIECTLHLDADADLVFADPTDLELVLFNLGKNAADAMPDGGVLSISTARTVIANGAPTGEGCAAIALRVQDTGTGIEPAAMARIFEPFYTTKAREHGTGLGLATVQRIVQQHGGQITVTSAPRLGTTFVVTLPMAATADAEREPPSTPRG